MAPIIACSVISVAICFERFWSLRSSQILPKNLLAKVLNWIKNNEQLVMNMSWVYEHKI